MAHLRGRHHHVRDGAGAGVGALLVVIDCPPRLVPPDRDAILVNIALLRVVVLTVVPDAVEGLLVLAVELAEADHQLLRETGRFEALVDVEVGVFGNIITLQHCIVRLRVEILLAFADEHG